MTLKQIIKKQLIKTKKCRTKRALVECLCGKGYVIVNIQEFSKALEKEIKEFDVNVLGDSVLYDLKDR